MILVTGGAGYIGSVLVPELLALGHHVRVVDTLWFGNPFPPHERLQVIEGDLRFPEPAWLHDVHAVIHLAAPAFFEVERTGNVKDGLWQNPLECSGLTFPAGQEVTSLQITTIDLWSTRLVVLAGCATPVGEPGLWSKVSGVVSACFQAGARNAAQPELPCFRYAPASHRR